MTAPECRICGGDGYYLVDVPVGDPLFGKLQTCSCRRTELQRKEAARLQGELGRYATCTFETFATSPSRRPLPPVAWGEMMLEESQQRALLRRAREVAQTYAEAPEGWLYLYGTYGAGKSHLAAAILNACQARGQIGAYASTSDVLRHVHDGFADGSASERLRTLRSLPLLALDDLKGEYLKAGGRAAETLWEVLDPRYRQSLPTIITSNVHPDDLGDPRLASRIAELAQGRICWLAVADYRRLTH